jgi:polygalacturonase
LACEQSEEIAAISYVCDTTPAAKTTIGAQSTTCGADDPNLPPEPTMPTEAEVCETLVAEKSAPDEDKLDTDRIQAALDKCKDTTARKAVKLISDGVKNAFVADSLTVQSVTLWVDKGTTLYASRDAKRYQKTGNCGIIGVNDSGACNDFISVMGTNPGIVGDGVIDGQGGEPLVGRDYSWWQMSYALRETNGSIGNPTLINVIKDKDTGKFASGFLLYRIKLHNSPKFHVKLASTPADGTCDSPGEGFIVWGVSLLTPSRWKNSKGEQLTPSFARNTDGIDPGSNEKAVCGVMACNTISTGDDNIAIKGGHYVADLVIAHNSFGTGHGMSIGSETYGDMPPSGRDIAVENIQVYDLTIDGDSRAVGVDSTPGDFNGIRIKSDISRGGVVDNISYRDVCMRDLVNAILVTPAYNPLFAGNQEWPGKDYPQFKQLSFQNIRHVTCKGTRQATITLQGFDETLTTGPVTLDNVTVDNIGPLGVAAEYVDVILGPGDVNFTPRGHKVKVTDKIAEDSAPRKCVFPTLPIPEGKPSDWLW